MTDDAHALQLERERRIDDRFASLRDALHASIVAQEKAAQIALTAQEKAVDVALLELNRRLENLNNSHELARRKEVDFISVTVHDRDIAELSANVKRLEGFQNRILGLALIAPLATALIAYVLSR